MTHPGRYEIVSGARSPSLRLAFAVPVPHEDTRRLDVCRSGHDIGRALESPPPHTLSIGTAGDPLLRGWSRAAAGDETDRTAGETSGIRWTPAHLRP